MRFYVLGTLLFLFYSCKQKKVITRKADSLYLHQIDSIKNLLKEGDIVFRGGTDIESAIIREFSKTDKTFSHCGIVVKTDTGLAITHILGGYTNPQGTILTQSIQNFLQFPENESAGVYSTGLSVLELEKLYNFIDSVKNKKVTFDIKFNLFTKDKLYCTEFLIDAFQYAKGKKDIFLPVSYSVQNSKYHFLTNSGLNFLFYPIDNFQQNKNITLKKIFFFANFHL